MDKKEKKFEENLKELETIVGRLESGEISLDDAIKEYKKAMELANKCNKTLEEANKTIAKVLNKDNELEDFEIE